MKLKLTVHAQKRIKERGVDVEHIKKAIAKPDLKEKHGDGKFKATKKIRKRKIVVVYCMDGFRFKNKQGDEYIIVTAYYL